MHDSWATANGFGPPPIIQAQGGSGSSTARKLELETPAMDGNSQVSAEDSGAVAQSDETGESKACRATHCPRASSGDSSMCRMHFRAALACSTITQKLA